jgi:alkylhydroperoxidase family enzyme
MDHVDTEMVGGRFNVCLKVVNDHWKRKEDDGESEPRSFEEHRHIIKVMVEAVLV